MATLLRRVTGVLLALVMTGLVAGALASPAYAVDGYRYWNYFHLEGDTWSFSKVGAGQYQPEDGDIEGYRFGTSTTAQGIPPRTDLDKVTFEAICGAEEASAGEKRVGVVLDFGTAADAEGQTPPQPRAECAVVDKDASGQDVLASVVQVRTKQGGLTCALDGYPATGCGDAVADAPEPTREKPVAFALPASGEEPADGEAPAAEESGDGGLLWPLLGAGVLVALIGGGGLALSRRNRAA